MKKILTVLCATVLTVACTQNQATAAKEDTVPPQPEKTYTLQEDIGEMLLVGFSGTSIGEDHHIRRDIEQYHVGSVILFDYDGPTKNRGRNLSSPQQLKALCSQLHELNPDLLIGIDQEGGRVCRLAASYGFPRFLSAKRSAAMGYDSVRSCAQLTAKTLREMGINLNFAPVADVDVNPQCPVIGQMERSFSSDEEVVTQCCRIWIEEQKAQGVASCLKHFPGHGSSSTDTHHDFTDVSDSWSVREVSPYRELAAEAPMVMTAHVVNRKIDPDGLPASLSTHITTYLRDTLGFQGVIVTDDLAMGAITKHYSLKKAIGLAITAGADMLCLSNNGKKYDPDLVPKVVAIVEQMVKDGEISEERIHQSATRVRNLKASLKANTATE